jgi:hypothetical protein
MCIKINKIGKQEVGIWWVQKRFPRYGVPIWSLWPNIRFLPSIVAEKTWEAFLDPSDSYFLFADFVDFYTHLTYICICTFFSATIDDRNLIFGHCDEKCAYMFNVYRNQLSRQTGSRNLTGSKTLPTIWHTYMKLVTKYQIPVINSCSGKFSFSQHYICTQNV